MIPTTATEIAARWHALVPDLRAALIREWVPRRIRQARRIARRAQPSRATRGERALLVGRDTPRPENTDLGRFGGLGERR